MGFGWFVLGFLLGSLFSLLLIVTVLRWTWRHKQILTELIREIYHVDLMPFICRIEGLLNIIKMEFLIDPRNIMPWVDMALDQIKLLKAQIIKAVSKYQKYQE